MFKPDVSLDDSFATETEPEEVDLDTSFHCSQEESTTEYTTELEKYKNYSYTVTPLISQG